MNEYTLSGSIFTGMDGNWYDRLIKDESRPTLPVQTTFTDENNAQMATIVSNGQSNNVPTLPESTTSGEGEQNKTGDGGQNFLPSPDSRGNSGIGPTKTSAYPVSPPPMPLNYYGAHLTQPGLNEAALYEAKKIADLNVKLIETSNLYYLKRDFELLKESIKKRQAEAYEKLKARRELTREEPRENDEGYLTIARTAPDGPTYYSRPIFSVANLRMQLLVSEKRASEIELLSWRGCPKPLRLASNGNVTLLAKELGRAGIGIFLNKNIRVSALELTYAYLRASAEIVTLWPHFGWCQSSDGKWHFATEEEVTYDDFNEKEIKRCVPQPR